jgi:hypothetical protein
MKVRIPMNVFSILLRLLFNSSPKFEISNEEKSQFDNVYEKAMVKEDRVIV